MTEMGKKIKEARILKGLKQEELANLLGRSKSAISNWERGDNSPEAELLGSLCGILDLSPNILMGWEELKKKDDGIPNVFHLGTDDDEAIQKYAPDEAELEMFLQKKYPPEAVAEIKSFFNYIDHKYNIK